MKKLLVFLLISLVFTQDPGTCKNGEIVDGKCKCPDGQLLENGDCVDGKNKCIGGKIVEGQCYCPPTKKLDKDECVIADGKM